VSVVVDASVTMAWCFGDEATAYTEAVLDYIRDSGSVVPGIWPLEVANTLLIGERRGRLTVVKTALFIDLLRDLPVAVDDQTIGNAWGSITALGRQYAITAYDACYVDLAIRRRLPLATVDNRMTDVASQLGIPLFAPPGSATNGRIDV
jgi:predicted nucleic acid-binding protein